MVAALIYPFTALPQVYNIWILQNVAGVSLASWIMWFIFLIPFLIYGIIHKLKQIIVLNSLWMVIDTLVISGIIIYS